MNKLQRPLGLILITKDEASGRVLYMCPHSIELPSESLDEENLLDTNPVLIETNRLVDGQRISDSADDSDGDAVQSLEKLNDDVNRVPQSPVASGRTTHKSENQTRSTNFEQENDRRRDLQRSQQQFNSFDDSTSLDNEESSFEFKKTVAKNNYHSSNNQRKPNNSADSLLNGDFNRLNDDTDPNKRREKKSRLPIKVIMGMLKPIEDLSEVPFEIIIDTARYVCNPWLIRKTAQCIAVVFVLHASCNDQIVQAYQNLSRKLATAIDTEQNRCGYLRDEIQAIQPFLERIEDFDNELQEPMAELLSEENVSFADIERHSSLARTLRQVYEDIYQYGIVDIFINDCIQVGFCVDPSHAFGQNTLPLPAGDIVEITRILQPYHTVLFFEDCVPGPDANPYVLRFFEHYDLERSLNEIGMFSRMPLEQVKAVARHYILWGCAKIVYPLCNTNIYSTMESNPTTKTSCTAFRRLFGSNVGLGTILSAFHPPITLDQFLEEQSLYSSQRICKQMIVFLLRNNYITQLHNYLYLMAPDSQAERFQQPLSDAELNSLSNRVKTQIRQFKQVDETIRNALLRIALDTINAGMSDPDFFLLLSTFISIHPFLNGEYHVESIMYHRQMDRSEITRILDLFADIVIVLTSQAQIVRETSSEFPKHICGGLSLVKIKSCFKGVLTAVKSCWLRSMGTASSIAAGTANTIVGRRHLTSNFPCNHRPAMNENPELALASDWLPPLELLPHLELGDLVEFDRGHSSTVAYYHWGVYCGTEDGIKVLIHFSTEQGDFENPSGKHELKSKLTTGSLAHIRSDPFVTVAGESLRARINNTLDGYYHPFPPIIIRDRAIAKLGSTGYNLLFNNCEQFSKWCRYGRSESDQSSTFTTGVTTAAALLFTGSASAAIGAGLTMYATVKIGRKIVHRYFPTNII